MTTTEQIHELANQLVAGSADSVFLYGSRARGDYRDGSDWEVGAIYERSRIVSRLELAKKAPNATVIYPFIRDEIESGIVKVPFTQSIWLTELILTGKTLAGKQVVERLELPKITTTDLLEDVSFYKARALDAMIALRSGCKELGTDLLVKSCLFSLRDFMLLQEMNFPLSYTEIVENCLSLLSDEYKTVLENVVEVRRGNMVPTLNMTFDNLGIFSDVIEPLIQKTKI